MLGVGLAMLGGARAQLCFDVFSGNDNPLLTCADTDFFIDDSEPGFDPDSFTGFDTGEFSAELDGFDLFDDPNVNAPPNLGNPFFSRADTSITTNGTGDATGITFLHRGVVTMSPADSEFQSAAFGARSRVTFVAINTIDPNAPIELKLDIDFDFELTDPIDNATMGAALGGLGVKVNIGEPDLEPEFDFSALAELDTADIDDELNFFGFDDPDLDDGIVAFGGTPAGPDIDDIFDIEIDIEVELGGIDDELDIESGDEITIETDTFGSIFSDGFESGDTSAWSMSSPDTFTFMISSPDPNVIFVLVPEPSSGVLVLSAVLGAICRRRRR